MKDLFKVIVTGSRDWNSTTTITRALAALVTSHPDQEVAVAHGAAHGADSCADKAARSLGLFVTRFPADWSNGRTAGFERNARMLTDVQPDLVLAFKTGLDETLQHGGTEHCIRLAISRGILTKWCAGPRHGFVTVRAAASVGGVL